MKLNTTPKIYNLKNDVIFNLQNKIWKIAKDKIEIAI